MKRRYFIFDIEKCIGCFNCLHACKDEHVGNDFSPVSLPQKLHQQYWITTTERVRGQFPMVDVAYLTEPCNHCQDAPCVRNSNGIIQRREDGIVLIDPEKAKGAGDLSHLCPFGKISYNDEYGVSQKCTFCAHLLDAGWQQPRCVQACPLGTLHMEYTEPDTIEHGVSCGELAQLDKSRELCDSAFYIKNLHRWKQLFLGGTVTKEEDGLELCSDDCLVILYKEGLKIQEQNTNPYGEFKFDCLDPGAYEVLIQAQGYQNRLEQASLKDGESLYMGVFLIKPEAAI
jgi:Fe-S-cluster-containing dehydrogenase component